MVHLALMVYVLGWAPSVTSRYACTQYNTLALHVTVQHTGVSLSQTQKFAA
jgi:hypothetical protein